MMCFGCRHYEMCWLFWLSSLYSVLIWFGCHHRAMFWCVLLSSLWNVLIVLAVITTQCANMIWLSSPCNVLMCFAVITRQHADILSHLYHQQNKSSSVGWRKLLLVLFTHPATGNRILCKLCTSTRLHTAHPWTLQSPHHTMVFIQVIRYSECWLVSWESLLWFSWASWGRRWYSTLNEAMAAPFHIISKSCSLSSSFLMPSCASDHQC